MGIEGPLGAVRTVRRRVVADGLEKRIDSDLKRGDCLVGGAVVRADCDGASGTNDDGTPDEEPPRWAHALRSEERGDNPILSKGRAHGRLCDRDEAQMRHIAKTLSCKVHRHWIISRIAGEGEAASYPLTPRVSRSRVPSAEPFYGGRS